MTIIAVFSDGNTNHLIADSLISKPLYGNKTDNKWISTGVFLNENDQSEYEFSEGFLKIGIIQENIAIGFAGDVEFAFDIIKKISQKSKENRFNSFYDFKTFIQDYISPILKDPNKPLVALCGFMEKKQDSIKFMFTNKNKIFEFDSSNNKSKIYCFGSGESDFFKIVDRIRPPIFENTDIYPELTFSIIAEHLYVKQFVNEIEMITQRYIGGAIIGLYGSDEKIKWQPSRNIVPFINKGGVEFKARFEWSNIIYKTWHENGNILSSSMFKQNGKVFQRITHYSNPLSYIISINENDLSQDMKTFNADRSTILLLPKGNNSKSPAVLTPSNKVKIFDEIIDNNRLKAIRLNKDFFNLISKEFFVTSDSVIEICLEAYKSRINALKRLILNNNEGLDLINLHSELSINLIKIIGIDNNVELISEALNHFLLAWDLANEQRSNHIKYTNHNLSQFIKDIKINLSPEKLNIILKENEELLKKYEDMKDNIK